MPARIKRTVGKASSLPRFAVQEATEAAMAYLTARDETPQGVDGPVKLGLLIQGELALLASERDLRFAKERLIRQAGRDAARAWLSLERLNRAMNE